MIAHIFTIQVTKRGEEIPEFIAGRAVRILRNRLEFAGSTIANWIDSGPWRKVGSDFLIVELICPNNVPVESILAAINAAIKEYMPNLSALDWTTAHFTSIHCMNQDR